MGSAWNLHPKTVGAGTGGTIGILVVWCLGLAHVTVDPVVAGALTSAVAGLLSWLAPILQKETGSAP